MFRGFSVSLDCTLPPPPSSLDLSLIESSAFVPQASAIMFFSALPTLLHCFWLRDIVGIGTPDKIPDYYSDSDIDDIQPSDLKPPLAGQEDAGDGLMPEPFSTINGKQDNIYQAWLSSRHVGDGQTLAPGELRRITPTNILIALRILSVCVIDLLELLWGVHPMRTIALVLHNLVRGVLPAVRLHSQARIIDAVSKQQMKIVSD